MLSKNIQCCIMNYKITLKAGDIMEKSIHKVEKTTGLISKIVYIVLMFSMISSISFASNGIEGAVDSINTGGDDVYGVIGEIIGILSWLAFVIALFKVIQIGIMFMLGAGKSKNDAKSALIPWLVGAAVCVMFGTVGPWIIGLIMGGSSGGNVFDI